MPAKKKRKSRAMTKTAVRPALVALLIAHGRQAAALAQSNTMKTLQGKVLGSGDDSAIRRDCLSSGRKDQRYPQLYLDRRWELPLRAAFLRHRLRGLGTVQEREKPDETHQFLRFTQADGDRPAHKNEVKWAPHRASRFTSSHSGSF